MIHPFDFSVPRLCIVAVALSTTATTAQSARASDATLPSEIELSVESAVLTGLENSPDLHLKRLRPVVSGAFEQIERSIFSPELFADFSYDRERSTETARSTENQFSVEGSEIDGVIGVRQGTPTGTALETTVELNRSDSTRTPTQNTARIGMEVTQQLLRGLPPRVNLASLRSAELDTRADRYELSGFAQSLTASIEISYWRYLAAAEAVSAVENALTAADAQLAVVETRIEVGTLPKNERAAAEAETAIRRQALIDAVALRDAERIRLLSAVYPGRPIHQVKTLTTTTSPESHPHLAVDAASAVDRALASRPELAEAALRIEQGDLEIAVTKNGVLPKLEVFIRLGKSGYADSFTGSMADLGGPNYDFGAGLRLRHLFGNRAAKAKETIARVNKREAEEAVTNLKALIQTDVLLAINEVRRAHDQVAAAALTARYREQTLEAAKAKYDAGAGTMLAVTMAQRDLLQSRIDEIKAKAAYHIAKTALYRAEGTLLKRRGLTLTP